MTSSPALIVYDWNGCLFDDAPAVAASFNKVMTRFGYPPASLDAFRTHYDMPVSNFFRGLGVDEAQIEAMGIAFKTDFHETYEPLALTLSLRTHATEILGTMHAQGVRQVILSNHIAPAIQKHLDRLQVAPFFDAVLAHPTLESQQTWSPKGDRLRAYCATQGLTLDRALIIGDSPEEVRIARDLGLTSVLITGGHVNEERLRQAQPDFLINELGSLPAILKERGLAA